MPRKFAAPSQSEDTLSQVKLQGDYELGTGGGYGEKIGYKPTRTSTSPHYSTMRCGYSWPPCGQVMRRDCNKGRSGILERRGASRRAMLILSENVASSAARVWFNCAAALLETPSAPTFLRIGAQRAVGLSRPLSLRSACSSKTDQGDWMSIGRAGLRMFLDVASFFPSPAVKHVVRAQHSCGLGVSKSSKPPSSIYVFDHLRRPCTGTLIGCSDCLRHARYAHPSTVCGVLADER